MKDVTDADGIDGVIDAIIDQEEVLERAKDIADQLERKALSYLQNSATEAKSLMSDRLEVWYQDEERYHGERRKLASDDEWFTSINPPRGARIIDMHKARMLQAVVPDTHRMDFFELTPEAEQPDGQMPNEQDTEYAEQATRALRNDLINSYFIYEDLDPGLTDLFVFGIMYFLPVWELDIQFRYEDQPNPEYNPMLPPEQNVRVDIVDGEQVLTPIRPTVRTRVPVRQFDAPKARHIRATNVFPTEMDRDRPEDCTGVFIYDTCRLNDLRAGEIATGGYFYANLNKLSLKNERTDVPEVPDSNNRDRHESRRSRPEISKAMDRYSYLGRLRLDELVEELGLSEEIESPAGQMAIQMLAEKFDWDMDKLSNWDTWIAELVDDTRVLVRWQPSPYEQDKIPLVSHKLFGISKCTLGDSIYDRIREEEHARNRMGQLRLMHTQKTVEPPVGICKDFVEPRWWNAMGGTLKYRRNMMIPLLKGANINQTIQNMDFSPVPLQVTDSAMTQLDGQISESAHLPAVRQGTPSGGQTATEVSQMGAAADVMTDWLAKRIEGCLERLLDWLLLLHHQYTQEPRMVYYFDERGEMAFQSVPPEVWTRRYKVNLNGWESIGNRDVRAMNFKEFATVVQSYGWQNPEGLLAEYAKILQIRNPLRMIQQPEPQPPQPTLSGSVNMQIPAELLPASVLAKYLVQQGVEVSPEEEAEMVELKRAVAIREVADQANVPIPLEAALPPNHAPNIPPQQPPDGGMPQGVPGQQGASPEELRDHHAPGELETRQRGLHDAKGLENSMSKMLQNPANSRRATGV